MVESDDKYWWGWNWCVVWWDWIWWLNWMVQSVGVILMVEIELFNWLVQLIGGIVFGKVFGR